MWEALLEGAVAFVGRLFKRREQDKAAAEVQLGQHQVEAVDADVVAIQAELAATSPAAAKK